MAASTTIRPNVNGEPLEAGDGYLERVSNSSAGIGSEAHALCAKKPNLEERDWAVRGINKDHEARERVRGGDQRARGRVKHRRVARVAECAKNKARAP